MGVAWMRPDDDVTSILMRADASLYDAKRYGRDRVVFDPAPTSGIRALDFIEPSGR